jgi:RimJ/RimL family protein N-acetyltransferase
MKPADSLPWPEQPPTLCDDAVRLRALLPTDADAVYRACQDEAIQRYTMVPVPYLPADAESFVTEISSTAWTARSGAPFAVTSVSSGELLGACGLVDVEPEQRRSGAGYWVAPWARGHGVARRSLALVTEWALTDGGLTRVFVEIEPENAASLAAAVAAGFRPGEEANRTMELRGVQRKFVVLVRDRST